MERIIILEKSNRKGKRFKVSMSGFDGMKPHSHHFASDVGKTFIDHKDEKKKKAWESRHRKDKGYNNKHSGIFFSRKLLWTEPTLEKSIKKLEKELNAKIINKI
jgi:hypothetical protein